MKAVIIIPSLNPGDSLVSTIEKLSAKGFNDFVVVNDGSNPSYDDCFRKAAAISGCTVIAHDVNKGKGRALKTAFEYIVENKKGISGVITVDSDGQHNSDDVWKCAVKMEEYRNTVILGARDFSRDDVPARSRFGNRMTSFVFKAVCGMNISDTQTGLRAIPFEYLSNFCKISGERFEYESNMLLELKAKSIPYQEIKIQTIYINKNSASSFNPIKDSIRIYLTIIKFLISSLLSAVIDLGLFTFFTFLLQSLLSQKITILTATVSARIISSLFNYKCNKSAVFKSDLDIKTTMAKYYVLCTMIMLSSFGLVNLFTGLLGAKGIGITAVKFVMDTLLFLVSFRVQRDWVFKNKQ